MLKTVVPAVRSHLAIRRLPVVLLAGLILSGLALLLLPHRAWAELHGAEHRLVFSTFPAGGMHDLFDHILSEAYARLGYEVELQGYPAERALFMANDGLVDGEAGRVSVVEKNNPNLIRVPTPLYVNRIAILTTDTEIDPAKGWDQFLSLRTCIRNGYKFLESRVKGENCHVVSSYEKMMQLLKNGRVDVGLAEFFDILPTLGKVGMGRVRMLCEPMASNPMYHYLNKRHADLVPKIDAVLRDMAAEGRLKAIELHLMQVHFNNLAGSCPLVEPAR
ncbi:Bacterial extracellular solute-binding protein, family 3 [Pseudodesulfovibrio hydrargyri]|uniref:Bacterial extracellular solute-binding protein, family 3 n=1 Tax=Pseudodesulfovibrio hydrargyri TaxID=2125990 RepID=A0A1J5MU50_9BACT|nr:transporter substrate-binding domain-containing protein [Pseudodesulfovibrio hydrargyri]OIQ50157.1 Bacterial extracellular solute-binding protein, family 3 [Pseudodesulfovibrio hydrargyri]